MLLSYLIKRFNSGVIFKELFLIGCSSSWKVNVGIGFLAWDIWEGDLIMKSFYEQLWISAFYKSSSSCSFWLSIFYFYGNSPSLKNFYKRSYYLSLANRSSSPPAFLTNFWMYLSLTFCLVSYIFSFDKYILWHEFSTPNPT